MRTFKLAALAILALSTTACVETVDQGYGSSNGYYAPDYSSGGSYAQSTAYAPSSFYAPPSYYGQSNYYAPTPYYAPTQVVTQTRYVPVPVPYAVPQREANRSNDRRWDGNRPEAKRTEQPQHHDHPQASNAPAPTTPQPVRNPPRGNKHDHEADGSPDRHN